MSTIVEKLAALSEQIRYEALPPDVVHKTKMTILDTLGCALGGFASDPAKIMRGVVRRLGGAPEATILGTTERTSVLGATWANGTAIRYLDYNDTLMSRDPGHPSGNLAGVLALAEAQHLNGRELICGLVNAYEIQLRLVDHCGEPCLWTRGWDHPTNMVYGSAAAAARLLGLPREKIAHAMAIAGSQANFLSEIRRGVIGKIKGTAEAKAAGDGVFAALLAADGLTGPIKIFEGDYGYLNIVAGGADLDALTGPIRQHKIMRTYLKYYPVETMTQSPVQAALDLRAEHDIDPREIERVVVGLYDFAFKKPSWDASKLKPTTRESADHSFNYCVAIALLDGEVTAAQFLDSRIQAPDAQDLTARTELVPDPEIENIYPKFYPGIVTVHMKNGKSYRKRVDHFPGDPRRPMTDAQAEHKFRSQAVPYLTADQINRVIDSVWSLEKLDDVGQLTRLLTI
ncbi:MAG: MmgE/PrpD family protein [Betaproteobacteria bacterium]|nr:MmgE/PrpD family protein [Betaproteobacteria bacterium]